MKINKVIFVLPSIKTGGGNRVIIEIANQLILNDIEVEIIYPNNSKDINTFETSDKIKFSVIGNYSSNKSKKLKNVLSIFNFINKRYKDEVIIFTDPIMSIFIPLAKRNHLIRFVQADDYNIFDDLMIITNKYFLSIYKFLSKRSYNYNIEFIFNSQYTYNRFRNISKRSIEYKLVHPALSHEIFYNQNIRDSNEINICIIARKHPWKGFIDFIEPFNKGLITGIDNVFVISHDDLSEFDLSNVTLIKPKDDYEIAHFMNLSHIFISTSWWEGFGLPPIEAMACGCSVILSNSGGVNEYAEPNINCLNFEPKNQKQLVKEINILVEDTNLRNKLVNNALETVKRFSWANSKDQLLSILKAL